MKNINAEVEREGDGGRVRKVDKMGSGDNANRGNMVGETGGAGNREGGQEGRKGGIVRVTVTVDGRLLEQFDQYAKDEGFPTRSEAVGHLIRSALVQKEWESGDEVAGVVTIIYDHHKPWILQRITEAQHGTGSLVVCSQHAHLDHCNCMENIIVRGKVGDIRALYRDLASIKGMKHTVLTMTTTGGEF